MTVGNDTLYFTYGVFGPATVTWNGTTYYYAVNGQGDVTGIFDSAGNCVVFYNLGNAWGYNPQPEGSLANTLGTLNPLRYRSYVYDTETGYYYLQSRYYDPEIGRFINADAFVTTGQGLLSNNMFTYCINNPVMYMDPTGNVPITTLIIVITVCGGIFGGLLGAANAEATGGNVTESAIEGTLTGMIGSASGMLVSNPYAAVVVAFFGAMLTDSAIQTTSQIISTGKFELEKFDERRTIKTGFQTALGTAVPALRNAANNVADAIGTILIWMETSILITVADIAITNLKDSTSSTLEQSNSTLGCTGFNIGKTNRPALSCVCIY